MNAGYNQSEITKVLAQHMPSISRELARYRSVKGYLPKQASKFEARRSEQNRKNQPLRLGREIFHSRLPRALGKL